MRVLVPASLLLVVACEQKVVDDPFNQSTDPTVDPTGVTDPMTEESGPAESGSESSDSDDPSLTTTMATTNPTVDPDSGTTGEPGVCGDGMLSFDEVCDDDQFGDLSCVSLGFMGGDLLCTAMCQSYDSSGCYNCGNNVIEAAEDCEGDVPNGIDCESEGFTEGEVTCNPETCQYDTSACTLCGDGVAAGNEACDGDDLLDLDCVGIGFEMGDLACNANCAFDFSGCSGGQYIQDFEGGVVPGEFDSSGNAMWIVDNTNPIAGTWSAASGVITHSQTSNFTLAVNFAIMGTVEFTHEESTEGSFDYLEFWIDGVMQQEWSGINAAAMVSYPVAAGAHTLEWRYTKDGSVNSGSDRVWVDDIMLTGGVPTG